MDVVFIDGDTGEEVVRVDYDNSFFEKHEVTAESLEIPLERYIYDIIVKDASNMPELSDIKNVIIEFT